jgi:hypothetical protein
MVSSEGACAAYYNFGRLSKIAERTTASSQDAEGINMDGQDLQGGKDGLMI